MNLSTKPNFPTPSPMRRRFEESSRRSSKEMNLSSGLAICRQWFICEIHRLQRQALNGAVRGAGVADGQEFLPFCTPDTSGAPQPGMAGPDEFHEASLGANTPHALAILQTRLQKSEMVAYTGYVPVLADSFAERTELTPSRLFSSARRNCSREAMWQRES